MVAGGKREKAVIMSSLKIIEVIFAVNIISLFIIIFVFVLVLIVATFLLLVMVVGGEREKAVTDHVVIVDDH